MLKKYSVIYRDASYNYHTMELIGTDIIDVKTTFDLYMNDDDHVLIDIIYISDLLQ